MITRLFSISVQGLDGSLVTVEVDTHRAQQPAFAIVGLGDAAVQESRDRIKPAIKNSWFPFPGAKKITVNLAPADLRKKGPGFDLAIAVGIVGTEVELSEKLLKTSIFLWELALDGGIRSVTGTLPSVLCAKEFGYERVFVPAENAQEASLVEGIEIIAVWALTECISVLTGESSLKPYARMEDDISEESSDTRIPDFSEVVGQEHAKRALLIAAAGGHNILLQWPPWSGKTMLAHALGGILAPLTFDEMIAVSRVYSVAWLLSKSRPVIRQRPFRKVHHTASVMSIIGGGREARPGEISLAHKGVLFMDEFLEFDSRLLETLRQPIEDGEITINRVHGSYRYPAKFLLVGAYNPTPCGFPESDPQCTDSRGEIERYRSKLSGPILDRIDLHVSVPRVKVEEISAEKKMRTSSLELRGKVIAARAVQSRRFSETPITTNSEMTNALIEEHCILSPDADVFIKQAVKRLDLSTRAYFRILRLSRTIADLETSEMIEMKHVAEAVGYRETT